MAGNLASIQFIDFSADFAAASCANISASHHESSKNLSLPKGTSVAHLHPIDCDRSGEIQHGQMEAIRHHRLVLSR